MRDARCFAILANGKKVGFRNIKQFVGWSGWKGKRSFLFIENGLRFEFQTDPDHDIGRGTPGKISNLIVETLPTNGQAENRGNHKGERKFIAIDGDQIVLPAVT